MTSSVQGSLKATNKGRKCHSNDFQDALCSSFMWQHNSIFGNWQHHSLRVSHLHFVVIFTPPAKYGTIVVRCGPCFSQRLQKIWKIGRQRFQHFLTPLAVFFSSSNDVTMTLQGILERHNVIALAPTECFHLERKSMNE